MLQQPLSRVQETMIRSGACFLLVYLLFIRFHHNLQMRQAFTVKARGQTESQSIDLVETIAGFNEQSTLPSL